MKNLKRMIAGALGAATVGAFVAPAVVQADSTTDTLQASSASLIINPGLIKGGDFFAEYHQEGYTREMDSVANWGNLWKNPIIRNPILP